MPDEISREPLTPAVPASTDRTRIEPEDVATPAPLERLTAPPVTGVDPPALMPISPPVVVDDCPTLMIILPVRPPFAAPVAMETSPDAPELVVPELKLSSPLMPAVPAFTVRKTMLPLDVGRL